MTTKPIYFDYAATTPVDPLVAQKMMQYLTADGVFGNAASRSHRFGWQAEEAVDIARNQIAELLGASAREIVFTSGATEADNLAIKGVAAAYPDKGRHIITSQTEHKAVLDSCQQLASEGYDITYLSVQPNGIIEPEAIKNALRSDTLLVSIMSVNNETGVVQDMAAIAALCQQQGVLLHVDATQGVGKLPLDLQQVPIDLLSCSAHKLYGPKGIGVLFVRRQPQVKLSAQIHGGGHEYGMRSGTLPVHQIVGMGEAFELARQRLTQDMPRLTMLRDKLWQGINVLGGVYLNGDLNRSVGHILNVSFADVDGESLMMVLQDLAVSSGSACSSGNLQPSYVLQAMGLSDELARGAVRFSLGRFSHEEQVDFAIEVVRQGVTRLRKMGG